jgi:hypothetical protein
LTYGIQEFGSGVQNSGFHVYIISTFFPVIAKAAVNNFVNKAFLIVDNAISYDRLLEVKLLTYRI